MCKRTILAAIMPFILIACLLNLPGILCSGSLSQEKPEFTCVQSFELMKKCGDSTSILISSKPSGNVYVWHKSFIDPEKRQQIRLDVNALHNVLCKEAGDHIKGGNKVTAALTSVFQILGESGSNQSYYSVTRLLTRLDRTQKNQKTEQPRRWRRIFVAGIDVATDPGENAPYRISELYTSCLDRNKLMQLSPAIITIFDLVDKIQRVKCGFFNWLLQGRNNILEMRDKLTDFDKMIDFHWETFKEELAENHELRNLVRELTNLEEKHKVGQSQFKLVGNALRFRAATGPAIDSEQHLLAYLKRNLIRKDTVIPDKITGIYRDLIDELEIDKYKYLNKEFRENIDFHGKTVSENKECLERGFQLSEQVADGLPLGCILHMHTTKECCEYCAASLLYEFCESQSNFRTELIDFMRIEQKQHVRHSQCDPFFNITISYSKDLDSDQVLRPKGAFKSLVSKEITVDVDKPLIPFKRVVGETVSSYTAVNGYILPNYPKFYVS